MTSERRQVDWEAIERDYRAGQQSVRAIAAQNCITETAIRKRAKGYGWQRSLAEKVKAAVRETLVREDGSQSGSQSQRASDAEVIAAAAQTGAQVVQSHRRDIRTAKEITVRLFDELSATTSHLGEIEEAIEAETGSDSNGKRRSIMLRAVSLPSRASAVQALAGSLKHLIGLERQAFNLGDGGMPDAEDETGTSKKIQIEFVRPKDPA